MSDPKPIEEVRNGSSHKLLDAALLIFFVTAFCLTGSVAYVYFLQGSLNRDLLRYFEIKDYLEITVLWLSPPAVLGAYFAALYYSHALYKAELKRSTKKWYRLLQGIQFWFTVFLLPLLWLIASIQVGWAAIPLTAVTALTIGLGWCLFFVDSKTGRLWNEPLSSETLLWRGIRLIPVPYVYAIFAASYLEPLALKNRPESSIFYVTGSNHDAMRARVVFITTRYLLAIRKDDGVFVAIPFKSVDRIETPKPTPSPTSNAETNFKLPLTPITPTATPRQSP